MVPSHRQVGFADVALSFRYMDGIVSRLVSPRDAWWFGYKVMAGETPGQPCNTGEAFLMSRGIVGASPRTGAQQPRPTR